jgi:hypothetical protein
MIWPTGSGSRSSSSHAIQPTLPGNSRFLSLKKSVLWIRIRNYLQDPDPQLEVVDPDPDPKLDLNLTKNHQKISNLLIKTLKIHKSNIFFEKFAFKSIKSHLKSLAL